MCVPHSPNYPVLLYYRFSFSGEVSIINGLTIPRGSIMCVRNITVAVAVRAISLMCFGKRLLISPSFENSGQ